MLHFLCLVMCVLESGAQSPNYHGRKSHKERKPSSTLVRKEISPHHVAVNPQGFLFEGHRREEKRNEGQARQLGAVVYLFAPHREEEFLDSLRSVCEHLDGSYPILVVHGRLVSNATQQKVSNEWTAMSPSCRFPNRALEWVKSPSHDADGPFSPQSYSNQVPVFLQTSSSSRDYESMIGFWITDIFQLAHRRGLKYIMRLDTDSVLASSPREDPFLQMERTGAVYGYRAFCYDSPGYSEGIWNMMREYVSSNELKPTFEDFALDGKGAAPMMYTNFEVARVEFFRRPDVHKFGVAMLQQGTRSFRLGDAVIRAFQLGLFASQGQVVHIDHFRYKHSCHRWWWVIDDDRDCVVEEKDPFVMAWGSDPERFGPPIGQCYSSRMDPAILALENGPHKEVEERRLKVKAEKLAKKRAEEASKKG
mmetsp:Transcript_124704/g.216115  ORF Transcript_124704/g.216115 Transcript_124704/m.216115 type:complete len:421 (-) Transcript_124704:65-1327(-)